VKAAGATGKETKRALDELTKLIDKCRTASEALRELLDHDGDGNTEKHARHFRDKIVPAMATLREAGDAIETIVPHDVWPLPTYREMLFVK